ncbi:MAG TPA: DUF2922 domain-containing protein [Patescibacteria group bacterium]|nr:DUF2922 domain-containing protein [Patescibacteria group bacterium]
MAQKKVLELTFRNTAGKEITLSLSDPKDDLTAVQANTVMDNIVAKNIFTTANNGGNLTEKVKAVVRVTDSVALA